MGLGRRGDRERHGDSESSVGRDRGDDDENEWNSATNKGG